MSNCPKCSSPPIQSGGKFIVSPLIPLGLGPISIIIHQRILFWQVDVEKKITITAKIQAAWCMTCGYSAIQAVSHLAKEI